MNSANLPIATPEDEGICSSALDCLIKKLQSDTSAELQSITIIRNGKLILDRCWAPYRKDIPKTVYSVSKTFLSMAVGFAIQEGWLCQEKFAIWGLHEMN